MRGCSVNTADGEGMTSLHYAANYNKPKAMDAIINFYGANFNIEVKSMPIILLFFECRIESKICWPEGEGEGEGEEAVSHHSGREGQVWLDSALLRKPSWKHGVCSAIIK